MAIAKYIVNNKKKTALYLGILLTVGVVLFMLIYAKRINAGVFVTDKEGDRVQTNEINVLEIVAEKGQQVLGYTVEGEEPISVKNIEEYRGTADIDEEDFKNATGYIVTKTKNNDGTFSYKVQQSVLNKTFNENVLAGSMASGEIHVNVVEAKDVTLKDIDNANLIYINSNDYNDNLMYYYDTFVNKGKSGYTKGYKGHDYTYEEVKTELKSAIAIKKICSAAGNKTLAHDLTKEDFINSGISGYDEKYQLLYQDMIAGCEKEAFNAASTQESLNLINSGIAVALEQEQQAAFNYIKENVVGKTEEISDDVKQRVMYYLAAGGWENCLTNNIDYYISQFKAATPGNVIFLFNIQDMVNNGNAIALMDVMPLLYNIKQDAVSQAEAFGESSEEVFKYNISDDNREKFVKYMHMISDIDSLIVDEYMNDYIISFGSKEFTMTNPSENMNAAHDEIKNLLMSVNAANQDSALQLIANSVASEEFYTQLEDDAEYIFRSSNLSYTKENIDKYLEGIRNIRNNNQGNYFRNPDDGSYVVQKMQEFISKIDDENKQSEEEEVIVSNDLSWQAAMGIYEYAMKNSGALIYNTELLTNKKLGDYTNIDKTDNTNNLYKMLLIMRQIKPSYYLDNYADKVDGYGVYYEQGLDANTGEGKGLGINSWNKETFGTDYDNVTVKYHEPDVVGQTYSDNGSQDAHTNYVYKNIYSYTGPQFLGGENFVSTNMQGIVGSNGVLTPNAVYNYSDKIEGENGGNGGNTTEERYMYLRVDWNEWNNKNENVNTAYVYAWNGDGSDNKVFEMELVDSGSHIYRVESSEIENYELMIFRPNNKWDGAQSHNIKNEWDLSNNIYILKGNGVGNWEEYSDGGSGSGSSNITTDEGYKYIYLCTGDYKWNSACAYVWKDGSNNGKDYVMEKVDSSNFTYRVALPDNVDCDRVIFKPTEGWGSSNSERTVNISLPADWNGIEYYLGYNSSDNGDEGKIRPYVLTNYDKVYGLDNNLIYLDASKAGWGTAYARFDGNGGGNTTNNKYVYLRVDNGYWNGKNNDVNTAYVHFWGGGSGSSPLEMELVDASSNTYRIYRIEFSKIQGCTGMLFKPNKDDWAGQSGDVTGANIKAGLYIFTGDYKAPNWEEYSGDNGNTEDSSAKMKWDEAKKLYYITVPSGAKNVVFANGESDSSEMSQNIKLPDSSASNGHIYYLEYKCKVNNRINVSSSRFSDKYYSNSYFILTNSVKNNDRTDPVKFGNTLDLQFTGSNITDIRYQGNNGQWVNVNLGDTLTIGKGTLIDNDVNNSEDVIRLDVRYKDSKGNEQIETYHYQRVLAGAVKITNFIENGTVQYRGNMDVSVSYQNVTDISYKLDDGEYIPVNDGDVINVGGDVQEDSEIRMTFKFKSSGKEIEVSSILHKSVSVSADEAANYLSKNTASSWFEGHLAHHDGISDDATKGDIIQYIMNVSLLELKFPLKILDIEPAANTSTLDNVDKANELANILNLNVTLSNSSNSKNYYKNYFDIESMSVREFNSKYMDLTADYDLIYMGVDSGYVKCKKYGSIMRTDYRDNSMDGLVYTGIGDLYPVWAFLRGTAAEDYTEVAGFSEGTSKNMYNANNGSWEKYSDSNADGTEYMYLRAKSHWNTAYIYVWDGVSNDTYQMERVDAGNHIFRIELSKVIKYGDELIFKPNADNWNEETKVNIRTNYKNNNQKLEHQYWTEDCFDGFMDNPQSSWNLDRNKWYVMKNTWTYTRLSSADLTVKSMNSLLEYVKSGYPLLLADEIIYCDDNSKYIACDNNSQNAAKWRYVDANSKMWAFVQELKRLGRDNTGKYTGTDENGNNVFSDNKTYPSVVSWSNAKDGKNPENLPDSRKLDGGLQYALKRIVKVDFELTDRPTEYNDVVNSSTLIGSTIKKGTSEYTNYSYVLKVNGNVTSEWLENNYDYQLYMDKSGVGSFKEENLIELDPGVEYVLNDKGYVDTVRVYGKWPEGIEGFIPWKIEAYSKVNRQAKFSYTGYSAFEKISSNKRDVYVLWLRTEMTNWDGQKYSVNFTDFVKENENYIEDFKIHVISMSYSEFKNMYDEKWSGGTEYTDDNTLLKVSTVINYMKEKNMNYKSNSLNLSSDGSVESNLDNEFNMIVFGYSDSYNGLDMDNRDFLNDLKRYVDAGNSLLFAHDNASYLSSMNNYKDLDGNHVRAGSYDTRFAKYNTSYLRELLGMDVYGITSSSSRLSESQANARKYLSSDIKQSDLRGFTDTIVFTYEGERNEGFENDRSGGNQLYATSKYGTTAAKINYYVDTTNVRKINTGQITEYPFVTGNSTSKIIKTKTTHAQYMQLDLEDTDTLVWYTLNDTSGYYSYTSGDGSNNYYIYTRGNVTYTGAGHDKYGLENEEKKLFINTIIAALKLGNLEPIVQFPYAYKDSEENNCMNYYPGDPDSKGLMVTFRATDYDEVGGLTDTFTRCKIFIDVNKNGKWDEGEIILNDTSVKEGYENKSEYISDPNTLQPIMIKAEEIKNRQNVTFLITKEAINEIGSKLMTEHNKDEIDAFCSYPIVVEVTDKGSKTKANSESTVSASLRIVQQEYVAPDLFTLN